MIKQHDILLNRDSTGKVRVVDLSLDWNEDLQSFIIQRQTSVYGGKIVNQPIIEIKRGKASRTVTQQAQLEYNSNKKKYLDKGYKNITEFGYSSLDNFNPDDVVPKNTTNQDGILKPMLAKPSEDVSSSVFNKKYYGSRKINGVRCTIYCKDGILKTASRGAATYDVAIKHILTHPKLIELFNNFPNLMLDGEIYKHGWTLNKISGLVRKEEFDSEQESLEYYLYDIVDIDKTFSERLEILNQIKSQLNLSFNPETKWNDNELKMQFVPQVLVEGWEQIKKYHDKYVSEGWEGLVIRTLTDKYIPGKRGNFMIKVKMYKDSEYQILGLSEGLRPEDLCFIMKTPGGYEFKAKPMGDRNQKQWYRDHINELIGKMGTVKYFEMSGAGTDIPQQPVFICVRDYE